MRQGWLKPAARVVIACLAAAACGENLTFSEDDSGADAGVDAPSADAASGDVQGPTPTCRDRLDAGGGAIDFCDDFERDGPVGAGWSQEPLVQQGGTLELSSAQHVSGQRSLFATMTAAQSPGSRAAVLVEKFAPLIVLPAVIELELRVDEMPPPTDPYSGFVALHFEVGGETGPPADKMVNIGAAEPGLVNPYLPSITRVSKLPIERWYHVVVRVDRDVVRLAVTSPELSIEPQEIPVVPAADVLVSLTVGVEVGTSGGPVRAYVDDVVVHR